MDITYIVNTLENELSSCSSVSKKEKAWFVKKGSVTKPESFIVASFVCDNFE